MTLWQVKPDYLCAVAGIYFHIPFCRQACLYCDFHFTTSNAHRNELIEAMLTEVRMRSHYLRGEQVESIYFGGGTPSLLPAGVIQRMIDEAARCFDIRSDAEITLEANPDDLNPAKVGDLRRTSVNRLSIGVQSFFDEDLRWMNRAHSATEAEQALLLVQDAGYEQLTVDLIYGYPLLSDLKWQRNVERVIDAGVPHISAYSMTVEPGTALAGFIRKGKHPHMDEAQSATQFTWLMNTLEREGFEHYEISNFARPGHYARHNSNYWKGIPYLGIGPSAHSYDRYSRQWNIANNARYIRAIQSGSIPCQKEDLEVKDRFNEYIMTALRTIWGVDLTYVAESFGPEYGTALQAAMTPFIEQGDILVTEGTATLTKQGKLMADHIAAELFAD